MERPLVGRARGAVDFGPPRAVARRRRRGARRGAREGGRSSVAEAPRVAVERGRRGGVPRGVAARAERRLGISRVRLRRRRGVCASIEARVFGRGEAAVVLRSLRRAVLGLRRRRRRAAGPRAAHADAARQRRGPPRMTSRRERFERPWNASGYHPRRARATIWTAPRASALTRRRPGRIGDPRPRRRRRARTTRSSARGPPTPTTRWPRRSA